MRRATLLCVGGLALALALPGPRSAAGDEELPPEQRVFVEVETSRDEVYVGEPFTLRLRVGIDRDWFAAHGVPLFRRVLDLPLHVDAPWIAAIPGTRGLGHPAPGSATRRTLAVGDAVVEAALGPDRVRDQRAYAVVEIGRRYLPERAGEVSLQAPGVRFAWAERFQEDLLGGRTPLERRETEVRGPALTVRVRDLPEAGRPAEFAGLIGRIAAKAEGTAAEGDGGRRIALTLTLTAEGPSDSNLSVVDLPPLRIPGFHVFGVREESAAGRRTLHVDLAPLAETAQEVPPIPFPYLDPGPPARYGVAATAAVPLPPRGRSGDPAPAPPDLAPSPSARWPWLLLLLPAAAVLVWLLRRRRGRLGAPDPGLAALEGARAQCLAALEAASPDLADRFADVLAVRLACPRAAVIAPDLAARLVAAGLPSEVAGRAAATLERLVAARYGGTTGVPDPGAVRALLDVLAPRPPS